MGPVATTTPALLTQLKSCGSVGPCQTLPGLFPDVVQLTAFLSSGTRSFHAIACLFYDKDVLQEIFH